MRYLAIVQYDGTNYVGWQIQPNGISVEEEIEKVLSKILNTPTKIYGSGRTDSGVHALGQTFHFDTLKTIDIDKFKYSLNCLLPKDIHVVSLQEKNLDFNARYSAKSKTYKYIINTGEYDVFHRTDQNQLLQKLDINELYVAASYFIGEHNFQDFTAKEEDETNFVRNIYRFDIKQDGDVITFKINGNGFMRYMIRMMIGVLIEIGLHRIDKEYIKEHLDQSKRVNVPYKADACGLYLVEVKY